MLDFTMSNVAILSDPEPAVAVIVTGPLVGLVPNAIAIVPVVCPLEISSVGWGASEPGRSLEIDSDNPFVGAGPVSVTVPL
jgi:hypothetical protein